MINKEKTMIESATEIMETEDDQQKDQKSIIIPIVGAMR